MKISILESAPQVKHFWLRDLPVGEAGTSTISGKTYIRLINQNFVETSMFRLVDWSSISDIEYTPFHGEIHLTF